MSRRPFGANGGRLLVRAQNWIGDVVLATASLRCIRESFPDSKVSVVAKPWVIPILAHNPHIDEIIEYDGRGAHRGLSGMLRLARYLRARRFEGAILLQRAFEAALIAHLAGIPDRMGYATDGRGFLLTHKARSSKEEFRIPRLEHDLKLLEGFGLKVNEKALLVPIGREQKVTADRRLHDLGIGRREALVGFSPGAVGSALKRWHPERFAELAVRLLNAYGARVLVFGAPGERQLGEEICRMTARPGVINLAGLTSLDEAIALIGLCGLFVTNDSGLMHVGAALDVPLVAVFGPTDPARTAPWSERYALVHDEGIDCRGCKMRRCKHNHMCMDGITVERVFQTARELVTRHGLEDVGVRMERLPVTERSVSVVISDRQGFPV